MSRSEAEGRRVATMSAAIARRSLEWMRQGKETIRPDRNWKGRETIRDDRNWKRGEIMYIPEFVLGLFVGAVGATALIVAAAIWWDKNDKE